MIVLDLPRPPSVNRLWRSRGGRTGKPQFYLDPRYASWKRVADTLCMAKGWNKQPIKGPFGVVITLDASKRRANSDADNRIKAVLDFLERAGIVENDKFAEDVRIRYGHAPEGCRVELAPFLAKEEV